MHRAHTLVLTAVLILPAGILFAQEIPAETPAGSTPPAIDTPAAPEGVAKPSCACKGGKMGHGMMMGKMPKSMAATSDGGVVVFLGNKIAKYDKDLNLVKEVEFRGPPVDMPADAPAPGAPDAGDMPDHP